MLLINETRAIAALKDAGWPYEVAVEAIFVGDIMFPCIEKHGRVRMYDQQAIAKFITE